MFSFRSRLILSTIAASEVDLPEPVCPVTSTRPDFFASGPDARPAAGRGHVDMRHLGHNHAKHHRVAMHHLVAIGTETLAFECWMAKSTSPVWHRISRTPRHQVRAAGGQPRRSFVATKFSGMISPDSRTWTGRSRMHVESRIPSASGGYRSGGRKWDFQPS